MKENMSRKPIKRENRPKLIDMEIELFISPAMPDLQYALSQERTNAMRQQDGHTDRPTIEGPMEAFRQSVRFEALHHGARYSKTLRQRLIRGLKSYDSTPGAPETITLTLLKEGAFCERARDYESALVFYEAANIYQSDSSDTRYWRQNNLGFVFLYFRRFEEAESCLRRAIQESPDRYNAWKNLGVALEHQCQYEEAAYCYLKACQLSNGEPRSAMHLARILDRHAILHQIPAIRQIVMGE